VITCSDNHLIIDKRLLRAAFRYHLSGEKQKAQAIYRELLGREPDRPDVLYVLGNLAHCISEDEVAVDLIHKAIQQDATQPHFYQSLGSVHKDQGDLRKAVLCFQKARQIQPERLETHLSLGLCYHLQGRLKDAETCFGRVLELDPNSSQALAGLGNIYKEQGQTAMAAYNYQRSLELKPDAGLEIKSALLQPVICDDNQSISWHRDRLARQLERLLTKNLRLHDPYTQVGTTGFHLAYHGLNNKNIQTRIASFYNETCPDLSWTNPDFHNKNQADGKISIGIISRFLYQHTIGYLNYGIIKHLNRERYHVTLFRFPGKDDTLSKKINQAADRVIVLPTNLKKARRIIAQQALEILFYLDIGMDPLTYFLAYSRLAPVQCTTWGHADTTGNPNMDFYLSSDHAEPANAQQHYSEQLVLLNRFPMYCYFPEVPSDGLSREKFGLPVNHTLYICPQSLFKFHPDFDDLLKAILQKDTGGRIILFEGKHKIWKEFLLKRFSGTIPEVMDRIYFNPRVCKKDFLSIVSLADVILDTIHFNGGYTSLLCLACGVPIVTLPGQYMRGRMTGGLYKQIDLTDCIAKDPNTYSDLAVKLANDRALNRQIRDKIINRKRFLFEDIEAVHEIERFFEWSLKNLKQSNSRSSKGK
jgi:predicted O-linked N-acetylglucosamine transferase (SPINDLY family)